MSEAAKEKYAEEQKPCVVARLACGHFVAASMLDVAGRDGCISLESLLELKEFMQEFPDDTAFELRPVSFVRRGGLTFGAHCTGKSAHE
jgi:hypothetical protein